MPTLLLRDIAVLHQVRDEVQPLRGNRLAELPSLEHAWLLLQDDRIADYGLMDSCPDRADDVIDASGRHVLPAWCDSHSHIVYHSSREQEFVDRIHGLSYEEIAARGGGILQSAQRLRQVSEDQLYEESLPRVEEVIRQGTGALEIKSGYGLDVESELKMLRVIQRIKETSPLLIKSTFLGAHAIPPEYKRDRQGYIDLICDEMIPRVADEGLADYCDVFCEQGYFTVEEGRRVLMAGLARGLRPKVHANELYRSGGVQLGIEVNALSVDHLECLGDEELRLLGESPISSTLLPATAFFLGLEYAPARALIEHNALVTLASDYNPGTTPSGNMPLVLSLACIKMKMTPEEAVNSATINGAFAMDSLHEVGSITRGYVANVLVTEKIPSLAFLPYSFGSDLIYRTILRGK